jgi:hypothetical protein
MRFHIVIFITLIEFAASTHGAFGWTWGHISFIEPLLFLTMDDLMEIFGRGDPLLYGEWSSSGLVLLSCLCLMDHSLFIWIFATSCVIFVLVHPNAYVW